MIHLTPAQIQALTAAATKPDGITVRDGHTIRTARVLAHYGFATITTGTTRGKWTATITDAGRRWADRNATPGKQAANAAAAAMRAEYRSRATKYVRRAVDVLERLEGGDNHVRRGLETLRTVTHPGRQPAKVEAVGWWLVDNNYTGYAYDIGRDLAVIGEQCAYRAYPVTQRELDHLSDMEQALADIANNLGMSV